MKNRFFIAPILLSICASLFVFTNAHSRVRLVEAKDLSSSSEILIERDSLRVLSANNERQKRGIASTTKILTALCVIEKGDLDKTITITKDMVGIEGSSIYLKEGERITVEELLYGLMLRSGNDAAIALAVATCGSVDKFVDLMNETAINLGALDSHFSNPHGLDDDDHYSTAYDLAVITAHALKNPTFSKIVDTTRIDFKGESSGERYFVNKNKLLFKDDEYNGVKTGYTKKCGRCLVASRTEGDMQLIAVVLNCGPMFERCEELLSYGFKNYGLELILDPKICYGETTVYEAVGNTAAVSVIEPVYFPIADYEREKIERVVLIDDEIVSFLKTDMPVGKINVYIDKELIFSAKLFIINKE